MQALEAASSRIGGRLLSGLSLPARVVIDFDPWAISLDMTARQVSLTVLQAQCDTKAMPRDADKLLSPGDACRIQLDGGDRPLPLLAARLESVAPEATAPGTLALRFKWLLDHHTESQLRKFLDALDHEKGGSLS